MFREGIRIGQYVLIRRLGRGGFGEVWLAEKTSQFFTKRVALKLPHDDQVDMETIRREATLWEEASGHPNVLPILDAEVYDGQVVIVSEYADGGSLLDKLKAEGNLSVRHAAEMTSGILSGLEFLHRKKIIHRDIKPANILLQGDTPRLADFGISRAMHTSTFSSVVIGTDAYMSPEAFDGKRNVQTDIWSVGVVLYQLLKGSLPFPQEHPSERMFAVMTKEIAPLPEDVPLDLREIVGKALAKMPQDRFQSAAEMREDLRHVLHNAPAIVSPPQQIPNGQQNRQINVPLPPSASIHLSRPIIKPNQTGIPPEQTGAQPNQTGAQLHQTAPPVNHSQGSQSSQPIPRPSIVTKIAIPVEPNTGGAQPVKTGTIQPLVSSPKRNARRIVVGSVIGAAVLLLMMGVVGLGLYALSWKSTNNNPAYSNVNANTNQHSAESEHGGHSDSNSSNVAVSSNMPPNTSNSILAANTYAVNTSNANYSVPANVNSTPANTSIARTSTTSTTISSPTTNTMSPNPPRNNPVKTRVVNRDADDEDFARNEGRVYSFPDNDSPNANTPKRMPSNPQTNTSPKTHIRTVRTNNANTDPNADRIFRQILRQNKLSNSSVVTRPQ